VLGDTQGSGTIYNDDDVRQIFISDSSIVEGDSGTRNLVFTLTMSQVAPQQVTIAFSTINSSAESPSDYTAAANGVVTFAPGSTVQTLTIPVIGDAAVESDESFVVSLSNAVNAVIGTPRPPARSTTTTPTAGCRSPTRTSWKGTAGRGTWSSR
jgi:hypothetical protein